MTQDLTYFERKLLAVMAKHPMALSEAQIAMGTRFAEAKALALVKSLSSTLLALENAGLITGSELNAYRLTEAGVKAAAQNPPPAFYSN